MQLATLTLHQYGVPLTGSSACEPDCKQAVLCPHCNGSASACLHGVPDDLLLLCCHLCLCAVTHLSPGLQQFYPDPSVLVGQMVCVASNLKPAKLAGEPSQAMVLAAEAKGPDGQVSAVKPLQPPGRCRRVAPGSGRAGNGLIFFWKTGSTPVCFRKCRAAAVARG